MLDIARPQTPIVLKRPISLREADVVAQGYYLDAFQGLPQDHPREDAHQLVDR
jgi:hypothetical protein